MIDIVSSYDISRDIGSHVKLETDLWIYPDMDDMTWGMDNPGIRLLSNCANRISQGSYVMRSDVQIMKLHGFMSTGRYCEIIQFKLGSVPIPVIIRIESDTSSVMKEYLIYDNILKVRSTIFNMSIDGSSIFHDISSIALLRQEPYISGNLTHLLLGSESSTISLIPNDLMMANLTDAIINAIYDTLINFELVRNFISTVFDNLSSKVIFQLYSDLTYSNYRRMDNISPHVVPCSDICDGNVGSIKLLSDMSRLANITLDTFELEVLIKSHGEVLVNILDTSSLITRYKIPDDSVNDTLYWTSLSILNELYRNDLTGIATVNFKRSEERRVGKEC